MNKEIPEEIPEEITKETLEEIPEEATSFVREHWEKISTKTFAGGIAGAVIILLAKYYRHTKEKNGEDLSVGEEKDLNSAEAEAEGNILDQSMILETGTLAARTISDCRVIASSLVRGLEKIPGTTAEKAREIMDCLGELGGKKS
jgi:hypothetical protein